MGHAITSNSTRFFRDPCDDAGSGNDVNQETKRQKGGRHGIHKTSPDRDTARHTAGRSAQILDAAIQVFAEKGFHKSSIQDVAQKAGISGGTIYNYFKNKDDLLIGLFERINQQDEREDHFREGLEEKFTKFYRSYLQERIDIIVPNKNIFKVLIAEILFNEELRERYFQQIVLPTMGIAEDHFRQRIQDGDIREVDPILLSRILAGTLFGLLLLDIIGDEITATNWDGLSELLVKIVSEGLVEKESQDD